MGYYYTEMRERRQRYRCKAGLLFQIPLNRGIILRGLRVVRAVVKEGVGVRQASRIFKLSPP